MEIEWRPRVRDYTTPVENKQKIRHEIQEATEAYLNAGGKIRVLEGYGWETITRADIRYRWGVSDSWIRKEIAGKRFPTSITITRGHGCKDRDRNQDRYLLGEIVEYFTMRGIDKNEKK